MKIEGLTLTADEARELFNAYLAMTERDELRTKCDQLMTENQHLISQVESLQTELNGYITLLDARTAPVTPEATVVEPEPEKTPSKAVSLNELAEMLNMTKAGARYVVRDCKHWCEKHMTYYDWNEVAPVLARHQKTALNIDPEYRSWHSKLNKMIDEAQLNREEVYARAYERMNRVWGVVWADVSKRTGYTDKAKMSYFLDTKEKQTAHLFSNAVEQIIDEMKGEMTA